MSSVSHMPAADTEFGEALRNWRRARGMSQLELALAAGVSARHLSFLESNRAKPSRDMVLTLADALVLPRASRNVLLNAAGFAPLYPISPLDAQALEPLRSAMADMMRRHAPNPVRPALEHPGRQRDGDCVAGAVAGVRRRKQHRPHADR